MPSGTLDTQDTLIFEIDLTETGVHDTQDVIIIEFSSTNKGLLVTQDVLIYELPADTVFAHPGASAFGTLIGF